MRAFSPRTAWVSVPIGTGVYCTFLLFVFLAAMFTRSAELVALFTGGGVVGAALTYAALSRRASARALIHRDMKMLRRNGRAIADAATGQRSLALAVAHIDNTGDICADQNGSMCRELVDRLAMRLSLVSGESRIYVLAPDLFAWIVPTDYVEVMAERFDAAAALMRAPIEIDNEIRSVRMTFGAAFGSGDDCPRLIEAATAAAVRARESGLRWAWHETPPARPSGTAAPLPDFQRAMADGEIWIAFQPLRDAQTGAIVRAEALARWQHPQRGSIRPDHFIPLLEDRGLLTELTLFALDEALALVERAEAAGQGLGVAINIASATLGDPEFATCLIDRLTGARIDPASITLEISQRAANDCGLVATSMLERLSLIGVRISIDDFGTGSMRLDGVRELMADEIKIDPLFIRNIAQRSGDRQWVSETIDQAHRQGLRVVAEGVEDAATFEELRRLGCDLLQGWYVGKAVSARDFARDWLTDAGAAVGGR